MKKTLIKFPQEYTQSVYGSVAESHDRWRRADGGCLADGLRPTAQAPVAGHLYTGAVQGTCHVNGGREAKNEHTKLTAAHLSVLEGLAASRQYSHTQRQKRRMISVSIHCQAVYWLNSGMRLIGELRGGNKGDFACICEDAQGDRVELPSNCNGQYTYSWVTFLHSARACSKRFA